MGFFSSKSSNKSSDKGGFSGGKISPYRLNKRISRLPLNPTKREYLKRTLERYHSPVSKGITDKEFNMAMKELEKNPRDPISSREIKSIEKRLKK